MDKEIADTLIEAAGRAIKACRREHMKTLLQLLDDDREDEFESEDEKFKSACNGVKRAVMHVAIEAIKDHDEYRRVVEFIKTQ